jgi:hypothetical protein
MILFIGYGQLGNQLFQYAFLHTIKKPGEKILTIQFRDLPRFFEGMKDVWNFGVHHLRSKRIYFLLVKISAKWIVPFLSFLAEKRIVSSIKVKEWQWGEYRCEDTSYEGQKGLLPFLTYVFPGYFQSELFFRKEVLDHLKPKIKPLKEAELFLKRLKERGEPVFIHVRRKNCVDYVVYGKMGIDPPESYLRYGISWFEQNLPSPHFLFITDDPEWVEEHFHDLENKTISRNSDVVDFYLMTLCKYGILSPSTFSWWGAYFMKERKKVFAPKYWMGFKSKIEYHRGTVPSFAEPVEITGDLICERKP